MTSPGRSVQSKAGRWAGVRLRGRRFAAGHRLAGQQHAPCHVWDERGRRAAAPVVPRRRAVQVLRRARPATSAQLAAGQQCMCARCCRRCASRMRSVAAERASRHAAAHVTLTASRPPSLLPARGRGACRGRALPPTHGARLEGHGHPHGVEAQGLDAVHDGQKVLCDRAVADPQAPDHLVVVKAPPAGRRCGVTRMPRRRTAAGCAQHVWWRPSASRLHTA
jgi:hypothetical protein